MTTRFLSTGWIFVFILSFFWGMPSEVQAQVKNFGEVVFEDFIEYDSSYDSTMAAIVLFESGIAEFDSNINCYLNYHKRLLILNDEGLEYANIELPINTNLDQEFLQISAASYHFSDDGQLVQSKLDKNDIFESDANDYLKVKQFSIPGVKRGSIIEFAYRKKVGNPFTLPDWTFHEYLPVQWSEYKMIIPIGLDYRMIFKGNDSLHINTVEKSLHSNVYNRGSGSQIITLAKKDLPPVENLPFLVNRDDHLSQVITQLQGIGLPNYQVQKFFKDWDDIAKDLNNRGDFGKQRLNGEMKDIVDALISPEMKALDKTEVVYNHLVSSLKWNGMYAIVSEKGIRDTYKEQLGNTADINLLLVEMLRYAGVKAHPGLLSTRSNGSVLTNFALINQFNMTVAVVEHDTGAFIMDATSGKRAYSSPHPKILYRNVFVIREDNSNGWLKSFPLVRNVERRSLHYRLDTSNELKIQYKGKLMGEFAERIRSDINEKDYDAYWETELDDLPDVQVDSSTFGNLDKIGTELGFSAQLTLPKDQIVSGNEETIYLKPFLFLAIQENPFKKESRAFPIEFGFPIKQQLLITVEIPDGYEVDERPESMQMILPGNTGYYRFISNLNAKNLSLVADLNIASTFYTPQEYPQIKTLFQEMVNTQDFTIVLKKTH